MGLIICTKCGCVDNTNFCTLSSTLSINRDENFPNLGIIKMFEDGFLCSECNSGTWHNEFKKEQATDIEKMMSEQMIKHEDNKVFTSHPLWRVYNDHNEDLSMDTVKQYEEILTMTDDVKEKLDERITKQLTAYDWEHSLYGSHDPYVRVEPKIGRNDKCPCGSGKKYKKCCYGKDEK